jgi:hypothetical protein
LREAWLLRRFEARVARRATTSLFVSEEEAALFRARLGPRRAAQCDVRAMGNGIDTALFDPAGVAPAPEMTSAGPQIVFTGQMDYPPMSRRRSILPAMSCRWFAGAFRRRSSTWWAARLPAASARSMAKTACG